MRKSQEMELVRTRSCRAVKSEAGGRFTHHTSPGAPIRKAATSGDRGALSGDVSRLWCSGRRHAICSCVSQGRRAGKPTPAVRPLDLPFLEQMSVCHQVESGASFNADRGLRHGHRYRDERPPRRVKTSNFRHEIVRIDVTYADPQVRDQPPRPSSACVM